MYIYALKSPNFTRKFFDIFFFKNKKLNLAFKMFQQSQLKVFNSEKWDEIGRLKNLIESGLLFIFANEQL